MAHQTGVTLKPLVKIGRSPSDCWEWLGTKTAQGYGKKTVGGRTMMASRWLWEQLFGPIRDGMVLSSTCGNPGCVNPHHHRVCTQAKNVRDGLNAKLTEGDAQEARELADEGWSMQDIADKFGVSRTCISSVVNGHSWGRARKFKPQKHRAPGHAGGSEPVARRTA